MLLLRLLDDEPLIIATSVLICWAAYLAAEAVHVSGVIATVTSGLLFGWFQHTIFSARVRIRAGSYGRCIDCGGEIRVERLRVYPTAKRCVSCQGHREKTYASPGTPSL